jgi:bisanhydrobacterioruberin hydratase
MFEFLKKYKFKISILLLIAFYVSGIFGILLHIKTIDFLSLTPLNLLVNMILLLLNHQNGTTKQWILFAIIILAGFCIELIGVNTGLIFGSYTYGKTLGLKLLGTPIIIGVNWLILTYSVVYTFSKNIQNKIILALISATILVLLDFLIEPVATNYDFWSWILIDIPFKNYIAWFIIGFVFTYIINHFKGQSKNNFAPYLLFFQFIFFIIFNFVK